MTATPRDCDREYDQEQDSTAAHALFAGPGEMRALCRAKDWSATPLGPIEEWPASLRTAVGLVLASPTAMIVLWGPELVQIYNDGYREVMGTKHPAGLGQPTRQCWPEVWEFNAPLFDGVTQRGESFTFTDQRLVLERHGHPEEAFFTLTYSPVPEDDGSVGGVLVTVFETTIQVRARDERAREREWLLAESESARDTAEKAATAAATNEARYRSLFESIDEGFCVIEVIFEKDRAVDYRFLEVNPVFGQQTGLVDAVGQTMREMVPEQDEHWFELYGRVALTGEPVRHENASEAMGRWFDVYAFRIGQPEKRRVAVLFKDVTEARVAAAERERLLAESERARDEAESAWRAADVANRAKSQFLANMSHELRTPINAIVGYADLLEMEVAGPLTPEQHGYVERLKWSGQHLIGLINEILDLAKVEAGELAIEREPGSVREAAKAALAMILPQARAKGIQIEADSNYPPDMMYVGDEDRVRQILVNLLSNALKFTEPGGRVTVRCRSIEDADPTAEVIGAGPWITVEVEDTGIGIAPEQLDRVFDPFVQVDDKNTRKEGGTGLGLTISRKFARLMGGDLTARSRQGEGSCFTLWLPVETAAAREPGNETHVKDVQPDSPIVVIAFGEDPEALAALEQQVSPGVRLVGTTRAAEVAILARQEGAGLVMLDISNEDGAAWQVAHTLHELPELAQTAVLLLPSIPAAITDQISAGSAPSWIALVPKPFTSEQLTRAVSVALLGDEKPATAEGSEEGCDVLIVDDDPDTRRIAFTYLGEASATVREAEDGERALAKMRRTAPDVVVLDLMMPVLDGFGVLDAMRADPALARIPVVVLTAKTLTEAERQFLARTAVRVFQKGSHHLADVTALVLRAASHAQRLSQPRPAAE